MSDPFRTRDHVPDFDVYYTLYAERSVATRARLRAQLDVAYGTGPCATLDLFFPVQVRQAAPVHLFVHGGYWRMFHKRDFSFVADTVTHAGAIAAVMDYELMPSVRMQTIVLQVEQALHWLAQHARQFGGDGTRISVSGHSAGAQLCALLLRAPIPMRPSASLLLSGVYDLEPLTHSFLQAEIGITPQEVERFSPLRHAMAPNGLVRIQVGEHETTPFHTQATQMAAVMGTNVEVIPGGNHMGVALDLGSPDSLVGKALCAVCV